MHTETGEEQSVYPMSSGHLEQAAYIASRSNTAALTSNAAPTCTISAPDPTFSPGPYIVLQPARLRDGPDIDKSSEIAELAEGMSNPNPNPDPGPYP